MNNTDRFKEITSEMTNTYIAKNHDYGSSFDDTCEEFGIVAAVVRMNDKMNRLKQFAKNAEFKVKESAIDTLKDLANYCILTIMWLESKNHDVIHS